VTSVGTKQQLGVCVGCAGATGCSCSVCVPVQCSVAGDTHRCSSAATVAGARSQRHTLLISNAGRVASRVSLRLTGFGLGRLFLFLFSCEKASRVQHPSIGLCGWTCHAVTWRAMSCRPQHGTPSRTHYIPLLPQAHTHSPRHQPACPISNHPVGITAMLR